MEMVPPHFKQPTGLVILGWEYGFAMMCLRSLPKMNKKFPVVDSPFLVDKQVGMNKYSENVSD